MHHPKALAVMLLTITSSACTSSDSPKDAGPVAIVAAPPKAAATLQITGSSPVNPQAAFHATNGADWVGRAHNKMLEDILGELISRRVNKDACAEIERLGAQANRVPSGQDARSQAERSAAARRGLAASGACGDYSFARSTAEDEPPVHPASMVMVMTDVSPAAQAMLDNIKSAAKNASSSSALAANLNAVVSQAASLPGYERDIVYATASIAQSSFEYWEANAPALANQVNNTYGSCLGQYAVEATALQNCMGISGPPVLPTQRYNVGPNADLTLAAAAPPRCTYPVGDIIETDVVGGIVGALGAAVSGNPGAILTAGLVGGGVSSATSAWWKVGRYIYCWARNGGGGTPPVEGT